MSYRGTHKGCPIHILPTCTKGESMKVHELQKALGVLLEHRKVSNEHRYLEHRVRSEIVYQRGREDRQAGKGALETLGRYLDGWYDESGTPACLSSMDIERLRRL